MDPQLIILDELGLRVANIQIVNGYRFDISLKAIERARLTPYTHQDLPVVNYYPTQDLLFSTKMNKEIKELTVLLEAYTSTSDLPFTDIAVQLGNDISTALFRSTNLPKVSDIISPRLGGIVDGLRISSFIPIISEGENPWCGCTLTLTINYKIELGNFNIIKN